jgi:hypothetical protein
MQGVVTAIGSNYKLPEAPPHSVKVSETHFSKSAIVARLASKASALAATVASEVSYLLQRVGSQSGSASQHFFRQHHLNRDAGDACDPVESEAENEEKEAPASNVVDSMPPDLKAVNDIVLDCRQLLAAQSLKLQILTLSIIECALPILSCKQDYILPLLAQLWPSLRVRLRPAFSL